MSQTLRADRRGFSLLEMTLALGISGVMLGAIWQVMGSVGQVQETRTIATQASAVSIAAQNYINSNSSTILGLAGLSTLNSVLRLKVTDTDTGDAGIGSIKGLGFLPAAFPETTAAGGQNSFGQTYVFYVQRQDAGTIGAADSGDRLVGLLLTSGGASMPDTLGTRVAAAIGAAGGFIRSGTTVASGASGGWTIDFSSATGWSTTPGTGGVSSGHLAILTALQPQPVGGSGSSSTGGGATDIDGLTDGVTDYTNGNVFLGDMAGSAIASNGLNNTGVGNQALKSVTSGDENTALGSYALTALTTASYNTAIGPYALAANQTYNRNTAIGPYAFYSLTSDGGSGVSSVAIGYEAARTVTSGAPAIAIGTQAMRNATTATHDVAIGYQALMADTAGYNIAIGSYALASVNGGGASSNIAIGRYALNATTTGSNSVAIGDEAMRNATGCCNIAIGYQAQRNATSGTGNTSIGYQTMGHTAALSGSSNTAVGAGALYSLTSGGYTTAVGYHALRTMTTGSGSTAMGYHALYNADGNTENVAFGYQALKATTSGAYNTAVGSDAMSTGASGNYNSAVGYHALMKNTGASNTGIGYNVLAENLGGQNNTAAGSYALDNNTTGGNNTGIGYSALTANTTNSGSTALGYNALATADAADNTAVGATALDTVSSGTRNTAVGSAAGTTLATNSDVTAVGYNALTLATGGTNTAVGASAGANVSTGTGNTLMGYNAGVSGTALTTGSNNTIIGATAGVNSASASGRTAIGYGAISTADNQVMIGSPTIGSIGGYVVWSNFSDRRIKKDIADSDLGLDFVMALKPVSYRRIGGNGRLDYGFIAQDVEEALGGRETNIISREQDERGTYRLATSSLIAPIVSAIQQQHRERSDLAARYEAAQAQIGDLQKQLADLQARLGEGRSCAGEQERAEALRTENSRLAGLLDEQGRQLDALVQRVSSGAAAGEAR